MILGVARSSVPRSGVRLRRQEGAGVIRHMAALDLLAEIERDAAGAIVMDAPYRGGGRIDGDDPWGERSTIDEMIEWAIPLANSVNRALRPGGSCIFMGGSQATSAWEVAAVRAGLTWMAELVVLWNTGQPRGRRTGGLTTVVRWHTKPGSRHAFDSGAVRIAHSNILVCHRVPLAERHNPAQKPVELTNFFVSLLTQENDLVVDPFCGAGSTLVSAAMCGRPWVGSDIDAEQCRIAELRTKRLELEEANLRPIYLWVNGRLEPVEG